MGRATGCQESIVLTARSRAATLALVSAFGWALGPAAALAAAPRAEPSSIEEILTTDPLLLGLDRLSGLAEERATRAAELARGPAAGSAREALALLEAGSLEGLLAEATTQSASGGLDHVCKGFQALRRAVEILETTGDGFAPQWIEARLRYADLLAFGFCDGGPDCDLQSTAAIEHAQKALSAARQRAEPELIARALKGLAEVHRGVGQRREQGEGMGRSMATTMALAQCPFCPPVSLPPREPAAGDETASERRLIEEAVRIEAAAGVWTRGLVESLVLLARMERREERAERSRALTALAANGSAAIALPERDRLIADLAVLHLDASGFGAMPRDAFMVGQKIADVYGIRPVKSGMGFVLLSRIAATVGGRQAIELLEDFTASRRGTRPPLAERDLAELRRWVPAPGAGGESAATSSCDPGSLQAEAARLLADERRVLLGALRGKLPETAFRWVMSAVPAEDRLFREVLSCRLRDPELLRSQVERLLLRREIWRYRLRLLGQIRETGNARDMARAAELADLRRRRAEQRLRKFDPKAVSALRWAVCREDWPSGSEANLYVETEAKIERLEEKLIGVARPDAGLSSHLEGLWRDLLADLGTDAVLVGYVPVDSGGRRQMLAFVLDGSGQVTWEDLGAEAALDEKLAGPLREGFVRDTLRTAGEALVDPLESRLAGKRRILLLAAGPVRFLPWTALQDREGRHLGSRFTVTWLQWAGDAAPAAGDPAAQVTFVVPQYAPPADSGEAWPRVVEPWFSPLAGASREVEALTQRLAARNVATATLAGREATESAVRKMEGSAVVHFAAHGFRVKSPDPLAGDDAETVRAGWFRHGLTYLSNVRKTDLEPSFARVGLALAGANRAGSADGGDDLLTAGEAADLDLRDTRLVVLSGCETGFPTLQDAGGAYDLALGFRMAGARSVVASLWPAGDDATRVLMEELYRGLLEGLPVAEALWRAKMAVSRIPELSDPRFWAPFEVFGADAVPWPNPGTTQPGQPPSSASGRIVVHDEFEDDRHSWQASPDPAAPALIRDGRYILGSQAGSWRFATLSVDLPEEGDFEVSVKVTKLRGDDHSFFGLLWGFRNPDNFGNLAVTGDGRAAVTAKMSGHFLNMIDPSIPTSAVQEGNATNALRIVKRGTHMQFLINGDEVHTLDWPWPGGFAPRFGFLAYGQLLLAFDDFEVSVPSSRER